MKGLEKLTCIRLAEVMTQKGVVPNDTITDALYSQERYGESFVEILVSGGHITEWDLAKLVVEHFQLPFLMASSYEISDEAKARIPREELFPNLLVPIDDYGDVVTVAMPILTPYEVLGKIRKKLSVHVFPYVGLISENRKVLGELFPEYNEWAKKETVRREKNAAKQRPRSQEENDWMSIFDSADAQVRDSLGGK